MFVYCESWGTFNTSQIARRGYTTTNSPTIGTSGPVGPSGYQAAYLQCTGGGQSLQLPTGIFAAGSEFYFMFQLYSGLVNGRGDYFFVQNSSGGNIVRFYEDNAGRLYADNGSSTVYGTSAAGLLTANTYYSIILHVKISATVGVVECRVNGTTAFSATGLNTGTSNIAQIQFQGANGEDHRFGNFVIFDTSGSHSNTWPTGYIEVQVQKPNQDSTTNSQWATHSGSAHYPQVNETIADDDATYVFDNVAGHRDGYLTTNISAPSSVAHVHGTQIGAVARKDDLTPRVLRVYGLSGSTYQESSDISMTTNYLSYTLPLPEDPAATGSEWTISGVNGLEIGAKVVS